MQCSWVKRLFEDDFHDWKIIPLFLIDKHLRKNFKFRNNLDISNDILFKISIFLSRYFHKTDSFTSKPNLPSMILSEVILFNSDIKVGNKPVHFSFFSAKNLTFIGQLFNDNGNTKRWKRLKRCTFFMTV